MWFEIGFICCAAIFLAKTEPAVYFLSPVFFLILYDRSYSVVELLAGSFLLALVCCGQRLGERLKKFSGGKFVLTVNAGICVTLFLFVIRNYVPAEHSDEMTREEVYVLFTGITLLLFFSLEIQAFLTKKAWRIPAWMLLAAVPVPGFYMMERAFNDNLKNMELQFVAGNMLWLLLLAVILSCFLPVKKLSAFVWTVCLIFGTANYYVGRFRGSPVMPSDLMSAGTAFQVAGGYVFELSEQITASVLCWYGAVAVLQCLPVRQPVLHRRKLKAAVLSLAVCICSGRLLFDDLETTYGWNFDPWDVTGTYWKAGSVFGFATLMKKMAVQIPDGYSRQEVEKVFSKYKGSEHTDTDWPAIIVIMDETFSDLRTLGDFACTDDYLKNWYAVDDFSCRGKLYVSVYGGWTANSEFEFLTGCSMANCSTGMVPYQSYSMKDVGNLAGLLKQKGYQTTAVHPQYKGNWNRMRVYGNFGFQDFYGMDDFADPVYIRSHISDQSSFEKVIELYEKNGRGKQFLFNVTMQNHGGYNIEELQGMDTIALKEDTQDDTDVETYLTLIRESDQAIHNLIDYFRNVDEPVVICIFGDHLPSVNEEWVERVTGKKADSLTLEEREIRYAVPYMIWANYDTPYQKKEMDTSANYLGALLLEQAGIPQTDYTNFLLHMQKEIPVLNVFGYQTKDGQWHSFAEQTEASGWVQQYRMLQYNAMFDSGRDMVHYR